MFCPNCGNDCGTAENCELCGQELSGIELAEHEVSFEPPVGVYEGLDGTIELSYVSMTIRKQLPSQLVERVVLYDDIVHVTFQAASGDDIGYLAIRDINSDMSPVETEADAASDETALLIDQKVNSVFWRIGSFLKIYAAKSWQKPAVSTKKQSKGGVCCPKCGSNNCSPILLRRMNLRLITRRQYVAYLVVRFLRFCYKVFVEGKRFECLNCGCRWFV